MPTLYAATQSGLNNGDYVGPTGLFELWGHPGPASSTKASKDPNDARELWWIFERETGIEYDCGQAFNPLSKLA